ncbi:hypothetical protein TrVE_jg4584 [Triparma verrucosa]|nr:hypothetical protein TrVE_jg4584 [Triparma verrucosa]
MVVSGELLLTSFKRVKGTLIGSFCAVDWQARKKDPALFSFYGDLAKASGCKVKGSTFSVNLKDAVDACREYDQAHARLPLEPAGFVLHESRCGSTLAANVLEVVSNSTRVYAEAPHLPSALKQRAYVDKLSSSTDKGKEEADATSFGSTPDPDQTELLRDVHYLASRSPSGPKETFYKFTTVANWDLDPILDAFPETPWIYIMRNPVEVMMSYRKETTTMTTSLKKKKGVDMGGLGFSNSSNCVRKKFHRTPELQNEVRQYGLYQKWAAKGMDDLPNHVYCAAHLAVINGIALELYRERPGGMFVDYSGLVETLKHEVIPNHFGFELDEDAIARIDEVGGTYSKASRKINKKLNPMNESSAKEWVEDSAKKTDSAPDFVFDIVDLMLEEGYKQMLALAV